MVVNDQNFKAGGAFFCATIIRAISDKADGSASEDYPTFEKKAIAHSVRLVEKLMTKLA